MLLSGQTLGALLVLRRNNGVPQQANSARDTVRPIAAAVTVTCSAGPVSFASVYVLKTTSLRHRHIHTTLADQSGNLPWAATQEFYVGKFVSPSLLCTWTPIFDYEARKDVEIGMNTCSIFNPRFRTVGSHWSEGVEPNRVAHVSLNNGGYCGQHVFQTREVILSILSASQGYQCLEIMIR